MKKTTFLLVASILILVISCNNKEVKQLQQEKASLKLQLDEAFRKIQTRTIPADTARVWSYDFREKADTLHIPLSWRFDASSLATLAAYHPYIRFYSVVESTSKELKIVAIGVDSNNNDVEMVDDHGTMVSNIYNFAETCPGNRVCSEKPSVLYETSFKDKHTFIRFKEKH